MCGITGVIRSSDSRVSASATKNIFLDLLQVSQIRGKDSSGICSISENSIQIYKDRVSSKALLQSNEAKQILNSTEDLVVMFGHSRMETNGSYLNNDNNQPIAKDGCVVIHNGIIVNDKEIWSNHPELKRSTDVDTEVLASLFMKLRKSGNDTGSALKLAVSEIKGSYSIALATTDANSIILATNTGSLYYIYLKDAGFFCFASQEDFLRPIANQLGAIVQQKVEIVQLRSLNAIIVDWDNSVSINYLDLASSNSAKIMANGRPDRSLKIIHTANHLQIPAAFETKQSRYAVLENLLLTEYRRIEPIIASMKRCSKCILPESMPFIVFDGSSCRHLLNQKL